ncbi:MAG TPA: PSD1 and planctomycete cytochrome C domain-containing protein [Opitutaceae bacterium]|nr:PSD1 and planctomycete cytochrome C domain-containing protein [Opitutaceae bacterium]
MSSFRFLALAAISFFCAGTFVQAMPSVALSPDDVEFFEAKVRPILVDACYSCHSAEAGKSKGGLRLDTKSTLLRGGELGPALVAGNPERSLLIEAVRYKNEDLQMPPQEKGGKLSAEQIAVLEEWVRRGAPDPRTEAGSADPMDMEVARQHWAFQPVVKSPLPAVKQNSWVKTPVDAFVLAALEEKGLAPSPTIDPAGLLRRVTYDLTGLPPTPEERDDFLRDPSPQAYARVVERLLASPRYGERWGRFWLDVARYADTQGYTVGNVERRFSFSHTYRDYVIRAFNDDRPFAEFIRDQLAADQRVEEKGRDPLAAMGFLTLGRRFLGNQDDIIDDRIDVVTRGLLGLTVSCARCHDHKFDPIPTADYYSLHGIFASSQEPEEKPLLTELVETDHAYQSYLTKKAAIETRIEETERAEVEKFRSEIRLRTADYLVAVRELEAMDPLPKLEDFAGARGLNREALERWKTYLADPKSQADPVLGPWQVLKTLPADTFAAEAAVLIAEWRQQPGTLENPARATLLEALSTSSSTLECVVDVYRTLTAGAETAWRSAVERAVKEKFAPPTSLSDSQKEAFRSYLAAPDLPPALPHELAAKIIRRQINTKTASMKREIEALNWTEPGAPLRAMALEDKPKPANSPIYLRGKASNRGAEVPRWFLEILSSGERTPATSTSGRRELAEAIVATDNPLAYRVYVNRIWGWHFGEALVRTPSDFGIRTEKPVHHALLDWLAASFLESGGSTKALHRSIVLSSTYQQRSDETVASAADPDNQLIHRFNRRRLEFEALRDTLLAVSGQLDFTPGGLPDDLTREPFTRRRTVYGFIDRQNLPGMFRTFDFASPDTSSAQRLSTTVPQQALFMMNSTFVMELSRALAKRPEVSQAGSPQAVVRALYRLILQREPDAEERALGAAYLVSEPNPSSELATDGSIVAQSQRPETSGASESLGTASSNEPTGPADSPPPERRSTPAVPSSPPALTRSETLAQLLLLSNEVAFVD